MPATPTLDDLRRYAVARTLFKPTALLTAIRRLGFLQADPIRAPARAQDLTLRHRVKDYRAGDLERRYTRLPVEEDCLVNYGFLPREHLALMHPRVSKRAWDAETHRRAADVLAFVRERGSVHPREVDQAFAHGRVTNYWGGTSNASTHLLDGMHYRGMLRVQRRDSGTRIYAVAEHAEPDSSEQAQIERAAALIDLVVRKYAPLPSASLTYLVRLLGYGAPHLAEQTRRALALAKQQLASCTLEAPPGTGRRTRIRARAAMHRMSRCACWRRSTRWCGTAAVSSCCGIGCTSSRPTRLHRSASMATTHCRCCGMSRWWAGPT